MTWRTIRYPQLAKMSNDPKFVELTADVLTIFLLNKTPTVNSEKHFLYLFLRRERSHPLRRGLGRPVMGAARAKCRPSRLLGRRDRAIIRLSCQLLIPPTLA